jgi:hypothetical protein
MLAEFVHLAKIKLLHGTYTQFQPRASQFNCLASSQIPDIFILFCKGKKRKIQVFLTSGHSWCDLGQETDFSHRQGSSAWKLG